MAREAAAEAAAEAADGEAADGGAAAGGMVAGSLVVCVHGCNEVSQKAVSLARRHGAGWLVVPCCMPNSDAPLVESLKLSDEQRYALLCGALAHKYGADLTTMVDRRVTGRHLVLAGRGGGADAPPPPPPPGRLPTFRGPHVAAP